MDKGQELITGLTTFYQKHSLLPHHFSGGTDKKYEKTLIQGYPKRGRQILLSEGTIVNSTYIYIYRN